MSTRTGLRPQTVITAGDMSDDITSPPTIMQGLSMLSYAITWDGTTPIGTMAAQLSNDYSIHPDGTVNNSGTWNTIPILLSDGTTATSAPVTGDTGTGFFDIETAAYAARIVYTSTSGTGTMTAIVTGKVS